MQDLKILALQPDLFWENPEKNLNEFENQIADKFDSHHLIILPETFTTGFPVDPHIFAEEISGKTVSWMRQISAKYNAVITGSLLIKTGDIYANTLIWMLPDGSFNNYKKRHVFSMGGEHEKITAGTDKLIVNLLGWKISLFICYDLRFPIWSKNTYNKEEGFEYDLAIYVANWPTVRSHPWKTLLLARAIENQAYVVGVNRIGKDGLGNKYSGDSMIIDPKGKVLAQGNNFKSDVLSTELSYNEMTKFRNKFNVGNDWDKFVIE